MNRKKALEMLGFSEGNDPSEREIVKKYRILALKFHPDHHQNEPTDIQKQYKEKFIKLDLAYKSLTQKIEKNTNSGDWNINSAEDLKLYLFIALSRQYIAFLKKLFSEFKSSKDGKFGDYINEKHFGGDLPLFSAVSSSNVDLVKLLLEHGANPNVKKKYGESLLHEACFAGHDNITKLLLENGADPYIQNKCGESLLYKAYSEKRDDIVKLLLEHSASSDIKSERVQSLLRKACSQGRGSIVELLLKHDANPDVKDQKGRSLFYCIIGKYGTIDNCYKVVELLLDKGANPNMQDDLGRAPLHYLCKHGYRKDSVEIAKLLLRRGADPDLKDKSGKKPIDHVNPGNDVGELFGAINYEKAAILGIAALLATTCSIALVYLAMNVSINIIQVSCFVLTAVMATAALCCACYAVKTLFFSPGPLSEFTEAREEFLKSQKSPNPAGRA